MNGNFEYDDDILGTIRKEGIMKPSAGFTAGVMEKLEAASEPVMEFKPLLSRRAWLILISGFVFTIGLCWVYFSRTVPNNIISSDAYQKVTDQLKNINFSFRFDTNGLLIVTIAMICMGILLLLDFWLSKNRKNPEYI